MFISPIGLMADYRIRAAKWGLQDLSCIIKGPKRRVMEIDIGLGVFVRYEPPEEGHGLLLGDI
jgi:hypothetical protein